MRGIGLSPFMAEKTLQTLNVIQHDAHEQDDGPNSRKRLSDAVQLFGQAPIALGRTNMRYGILCRNSANNQLILSLFGPTMCILIVFDLSSILDGVRLEYPHCHGGS
ncbi:MAG TPA: hypothetical protein PK677_00195 [Acidiphilium sp.]|nr:hypothetical protein [Acidiphilium sp.]HQU24094.1 hypothetical protein [Acidiphilium sp.]